MVCAFTVLLMQKERVRAEELLSKISKMKEQAPLSILQHLNWCKLRPLLPSAGF